MTSLAGRYLGAAALLGAGVDHLQQYLGAAYSVIPTIGTLFVLNFAASALVALVLFLPVERLGRRGRQLLGCGAAVGVGVAAGSLAALFVSEQTPLFGFMENGYHQAIVISIALEGVTVVLLGAYLLGIYRRGAWRDSGWRGRPSSGIGSHGAA